MAILASETLRQFIISITVVLFTINIRLLSEVVFSVFLPRLHWVYDSWSSLGSIMSSYSEMLWWRNLQKTAKGENTGFISSVPETKKYYSALSISVLCAILAAASQYLSVLMAHISPSAIIADKSTEHGNLAYWPLIPQDAFYDTDNFKASKYKNVFENFENSNSFWNSTLHGWFNGDLHPELHGLINKDFKSEMFIAQDSFAAGLPFMNVEPWDDFWSINSYSSGSKSVTSKSLDLNFEQYIPHSWNLPVLRHNITQKENIISYHWSLVNGDTTNVLNQSSVVVTTSCVDNITWDIYAFNVTRYSTSHGYFFFEEIAGEYTITDFDYLTPLSSNLNSFWYYSNMDGEEIDRNSGNMYNSNKTQNISSLIFESIKNDRDIETSIQNNDGKYLNFWGIGLVESSLVSSSSANLELVEFFCVANTSCYLLDHAYSINQITYLPVPAAIVGNGSENGFVADLNIWDFNISTGVSDLTSVFTTKSLLSDPFNKCSVMNCEVYKSGKLVYNVSRLVKWCIGVAVLCLVLFIAVQIVRREKFRITAYACIFEAVAISESDHYLGMAHRPAKSLVKGYENGKVGISASYGN